MWERIKAYRCLWLLAIGVVAADQLSKAWINTNLPFNAYFPPHNIPVIPGFFNIVHVGNTGAAWGLFTDKSYFLAILAAVTLLAIFLFRKHLLLKESPTQICFGLLCGGIVGNLTDRLLYGHVIDFLDFHFGSYVFPSFNLADSAICIGVGFYLLYSLKESKKESS
ncbi:MAG: signal peptidase II [Opitutaceae bacterium]|nr:signal peptidase II [Opitutaceae bacterium]